MLELNKIYCWDCLELMKQIPDGSIDLTVTSPPYDNLRTYNWFTFDFEWIAKELYRITKEWGVVVWVVWDATIKWSETGTSFRQALFFKECGFNLHDTMIYEKHNFSNPSSNRYHQIFEYMFVFSKLKPKTFNPINDRKNVEAGKIWSRWKNTVTQADWSKKERERKVNTEYWMRYNIRRYITSNSNLHPAIFPEKLAEDHIISRSNEWDLVFDPFMWSWTTAKMAKANNRNYIWCEISQEYVDIANKRLATTTISLF